MTHRWSILGATTSVTVLLIGQVLDRIIFPLNYQIVFICLSIGGLISYYYSSRITLPPKIPPVEPPAKTIREMVHNYTSKIASQKPFISFLSKRFVFLTGVSLAAPLFPLYYVNVVGASDSWISVINTSQTIVLIVGYFIWSQQSRRHGAYRVLAITTLGLALFPILVSSTVQTWQIAILAGMAGIFQAGLDLVFFDELMRTVPFEYSATFVSFAQSIQYVSSIFSPLIGSSLAVSFGIAPALLVAGLVRLTGFAMFALRKP